MDSKWLLMVAAAIALVVLYEWQARRKLKARLQERIQLTPREFGNWYFPDPLEAEVAAFIRNTLQDITFTDLEGLEPEDRFIEDLHVEEIDSLALVELVTEIEEKYEVHIAPEEARQAKTVVELVQLVARKVRESRAAF